MDEEVKYLRSKFYYLNSQISPEFSAQALHGPDQTPPAPLPVELGRGGWGGCSSPLIWKRSQEEPRIPWAVHGVSVEQYFRFLVSGSLPGSLRQRMIQKFLSPLFLRHSQTNILFFLPSFRGCNLPLGISHFSADQGSFSKVGNLGNWGLWEVSVFEPLLSPGQGKNKFLALTTLNVLHVQLHAPAVPPISEVSLFLFQPQRILWGYFTHENEDSKMTNPAGCTQGWGSGGCSRGFLPRAQHKNNDITS